MVAANHDGSFQFAARHQIIQREAEFVALSVAQPADARRQSLESDALLRQMNPACENFVVRKHVEDELVRAINIRGLAGKRGPAKRPASFAEKRADVGGNEPGKIVSVLYALLESEGPNVIPVIERDRSQLLQGQHAFHMFSHGFKRAFAICLGIAFAQLGSLRHIEPLRNVAANRIVRAGLIRQQIGHHAAPREFGNHVRAISHQAYGSGFALANCVLQNAKSFVEIVHHHVAVAGLHTALDVLGVHVNSQKCSAIQRGSERLRATHSAEAAAGHELSSQIALKMFSRCRSKRFVGALQNSLGADVDPASGCHLAIHHQAGAVEFVEVLPVAPMSNQV